MSSDPHDIISLKWFSFNDVSSSIYYTTSRLEETYVRQLTKMIITKAMEDLLDTRKPRYYKPDNFQINYITSKNLEYVVDLETGSQSSVERLESISQPMLTDNDRLSSIPEDFQDLLSVVKPMVDPSKVVVITLDGMVIQTSESESINLVKAGNVLQVILPDMWEPVLIQTLEISMNQNAYHVPGTLVDHKDNFKFDTGAARVTAPCSTGQLSGRINYKVANGTGGVANQRLGLMSINGLKQQDVYYIELPKPLIGMNLIDKWNYVCVDGKLYINDR